MLMIRIADTGGVVGWEMSEKKNTHTHTLTGNTCTHVNTHGDETEQKKLGTRAHITAGNEEMAPPKTTA